MRQRQPSLAAPRGGGVERWESRYKEAFRDAKKAREIFERTKELDALGTFKADLRSFTRHYEFMSQLVD